MTLYLIRHAHAGKRSAWSGDDDRSRPLSAKGHEQATGLIDVLAGHPIDRIMSSPFTRCIETVTPLAESRRVELETEQFLAEGSATNDLVTLLDMVDGADVVLCSHGDVIPDLLSLLRARGVVLAHPSKWAKGSTWVVDGDEARYVPPAS